MSTLASRVWWTAWTARHAAREGSIPWLPPEQIHALQSQRVRRIIHHAYARVPFYREAMQSRGLTPEDIRAAEDLALLPLVDAAAYRAAPERFVASPPPPGPLLTVRSHGTTGTSKTYTYDRSALCLALAQGHRQRRVMAQFVGRTVGYRELVVQRVGGLSTQIRDYYDAHLWTPRRVDLTRLTVSPGAHDPAGFARLLADFRPDVVSGYGAHLGALFHRMGQQGVLTHRPRLVTFGADGMAPADRRYLEGELAIPVISTYQASEALRIGFECERRQGHHLSLDATATRVADAAGAPVPPGVSGDIVISNLANYATVLLNYRIGDRGCMATHVCACGRTLPLLEAIEGRSDDMLRLRDGRIVHGLEVMTVVRTASGLDRLQVVQVAHTRLRILAVPAPGVERLDAARRLAEGVSRMIGEPAEVTVEWVDDLPAGPSGKTRTVISEVPR